MTVPAMDSWQLIEVTARTPSDSNGLAWMVVETRDLSPNDSDVYVDDLRVEAVP